MTNSYNPDQKRGGPANAGNWTAYENSDPEDPFADVVFPTLSVTRQQEIRDALEGDSNDDEYSALIGLDDVLPAGQLQVAVASALEGDSDDAVHDALIDVADYYGVKHGEPELIRVQNLSTMDSEARLALAETTQDDALLTALAADTDDRVRAAVTANREGHILDVIDYELIREALESGSSKNESSTLSGLARRLDIFVDGLGEVEEQSVDAPNFVRDMVRGALQSVDDGEVHRALAGLADHFDIDYDNPEDI